MNQICFLDLETTGVNPALHDLWEIGLIARDSDGEDREYCWHIRPDMTWADPVALRIGGYHQRCQLADAPVGAALVVADPEPEQDPVYPPRTTSAAVAAKLAQLLDGAVLAGANTWFDEQFLQKWLRANGQCSSHNYHLLDVENYAAGALRLAPPWRLDTLADRFEVTADPAGRHTALGDARLVRDLYDTVKGWLVVDEASLIADAWDVIAAALRGENADWVAASYKWREMCTEWREARRDVTG